MPKLNLPDVGSLSNPAAFRQAVNDNFTAIENFTDEVVSREGTTPNHMLADFDMNSHFILNLLDPQRQTDAVNLRTVSRIIAAALEGAFGEAIGVVTPIGWDFEGDGVTTSFPAPGADVEDPLFYDTAIESGVGTDDYYVAEPGEQFYLDIDPDDTGESRLVFTTPLPDGVRAFSILRGYARPATGTPPITTVSPVVTVVNSNTTIGASYQNNLIVIDEIVNITLSVRANNGDPTEDWAKGDYFLVLQKGTGKALISGEVGVTINPPSLHSNETRAQYSLIGVSCVDPVAGIWVTSGDLLRAAITPYKQTHVFADRSVLIGTNIAVGTLKDQVAFPYDIQLDTLALGNLYGLLTVAQTTGTLLSFDIKAGGVSIFSVVPSFDNNELTTRTAATPAVFSTAFNTAQRIIPANTVIQLDVLTLGTALAKGLTVVMNYTRAS